MAGSLRVLSRIIIPMQARGRHDFSEMLAFRQEFAVEAFIAVKRNHVSASI